MRLQNTASGLIVVVSQHLEYRQRERVFSFLCHSSTVLVYVDFQVVSFVRRYLLLAAIVQLMLPARPPSQLWLQEMSSCLP